MRMISSNCAKYFLCIVGLCTACFIAMEPVSLETHLDDDRLDALDSLRISSWEENFPEHATVISIACDPLDLYDKNKGIFVRGTEWQKYPDSIACDYLEPANYNNTADAFKKLCRVDVLTETSTFSEPRLLSVRGKITRGYDRKGLRLTTLEQNGISAELPRTIDLYTQDNDPTRMRQIMAENYANILGLMNLETFPALVYINKKYYGMFDVGQETDDAFFVKKGFHSGNAIFIKRLGELIKSELSGDADSERYGELINMLRQHDLSDTNNYHVVNEIFDEQNLINYYALEYCISNQDWPHNNWGIVKGRVVDENSPIEDGRWRFFVFDVAGGLTFDAKPLGKDLFSQVLQDPIFCELWKNEGFRVRFVQRVSDIIYILFNEEATEQLLDSYVKTIGPLRLVDERELQLEDYLDMDEALAEFREYFYRVKDSRLPQVCEKAGMQLVDVVVVLDEGMDDCSIELNGLELPIQLGSWIGRYCKNAELNFRIDSDSSNEEYEWINLKTGEVIADGDMLSCNAAEPLTIKPMRIAG